MKSSLPPAKCRVSGLVNLNDAAHLLQGGMVLAPIERLQRLFRSDDQVDAFHLFLNEGVPRETVIAEAGKVLPENVSAKVPRCAVGAGRRIDQADPGQPEPDEHAVVYDRRVHRAEYFPHERGGAAAPNLNFAGNRREDVRADHDDGHGARGPALGRRRHAARYSGGHLWRTHAVEDDGPNSADRFARRSNPEVAVGGGSHLWPAVVRARSVVSRDQGKSGFAAGRFAAADGDTVS